jgi:hypothetical protein
MSDYDSDGYEVEDDFEFEKVELERKNRAKYRRYLSEKLATNDNLTNNFVDQKKEFEHIKIVVSLFTEEDADIGILSDVGGYFRVVEVDKATLTRRRSIINVLTSRLMLQISGQLPKQLDELSFDDVEKVLAMNKGKLIIPMDDTWKDFKFFLTTKYMSCSQLYIERALKAGFKNEFNSNYIEFLLSKSRFMYHETCTDSSMESLRALCDSYQPVPFKKIEKTKPREAFREGFYSRLLSAQKARILNHEESFLNFSTLCSLSLDTSLWSDLDKKKYVSFLSRCHTLSYIEVDVNYNIKYDSVQNSELNSRSKGKLFKDAVLITLKKLLSSELIQYSEKCKIWQSLSLIRKNVGIDTDTLIRFIDSSGCNYVVFENDSMKTAIIQTSLGNALIISTPTSIFDRKYMLCKDIAFCKLACSTEKFYVNPVIEKVKKYREKVFLPGMDEITYNHFLFSYYARLSNIPEANLDVWMSKLRKIKAHILKTSSYIRNVSAITIQSFVRNCIRKGKFSRLNLSRIISKKKTQMLQNIRKHEDTVFQEYLEHNSSKIITRFFQDRLRHKLNSSIREAYRNTLKLNRNVLLKNLNTSIQSKKSLRMKLLQTEYTETRQSKIFEHKSNITLSNTYNNELNWFGFTRNDSLNNLMIASGCDVKLLEIKLKYTFPEFMEILKCIANICSMTKSYQFVKLCRSLSGRRHSKSTIKDFCQGFCWMYTTITKGVFLKMAGLFCQSTNNSKFMTYLTNNIDKIMKANCKIFQV